MKPLAIFCVFSVVLSSCSGSNGSSSGNGGANASGGNALLGGANHAGGVTASGTSGAYTMGGVTSTGTFAATGGHASLGDSPTTGGSTASGGTTSTRSLLATGGISATAGTTSTGGSRASGGAFASGGTTSTGGSRSTGGASPTGGASATGGETNTGGVKATGGTTGVAGSSTLGCTSSDATYKLVWSDEFNGATGTALDSSKWTYDVGGNGWGNSELEYYTSGTANASLDGNGNLVITAKQQSMSGMNYTSARVKTAGLASWTYGRIEARIKIPKGQGMWPAFWLLGTDINTNPWPACGEIDVVENVGKEPNIIHGSMHGPGYSGAAGPTAQTSLPSPVGDAFHVFAIEWEQNVIRWYVDSTLYSTKTPSDIPASATWVYAHPFFVILNVAVGGTWPGSPDATTVFPQQMLVDYVRVCQH